MSHSSLSTLPLVPTFAGHQTFAVRSGWLKKGLDALQNDPQIFNRDDAIVTLGVGKNMVTSIRHWIFAMKMARFSGRDLVLSPLGQTIFGGSSCEGLDPYLEDPATLWILHWKLCGPESEAFTWAWSFNHWREWEWTRDKLAQSLLEAAQMRLAKAPSSETVERDVGVLLQSYVASSTRNQNAEDGLDCPLRDLGLIRATLDGQFRFVVGAKPSLPPTIFAWALCEYWSWKYAHAQTLSVRELTYGEGSPGVVFKLDEDSVLQGLDELHDLTNGALSFEDTPLVRQVVQRKTFSPELLLQKHYAA